MSPVLPDAARRRDVAAWAGPLHLASLVAAFFFLLWVNRLQWFNLDEWNFLVDRHVFAGDGTSIWEPHNEHWSTTPVLVYRGLFAIFGVRTYLPYVLVNIAFHLFIVHLLWRLLRRIGVEPLLATCACAVLAVLGAGWENLIAAFQFQFFGSIALGLLALLVAPERGGLVRRDALVVLFLLVGLTFSGTGVTMVVIVTLVALLRRGARVAVATAAIPALVYVLWYLAYGKGSSTENVPQLSFTETLEVLPGYVWHGLVSAVDNVTGLAGVGPVVLVLLGLALLRLARPATPGWAVTLAMAFGAVTFMTLTGARRAGLGNVAAEGTRYAYVVAILLVPLAALAIDRWSTRSQVRIVMMLGVTAFLLIVQTTQLNLNANEWAVIEQEQKHRIMATAELAREGERFVHQAPVPQFIPNLTVDEIAALDRDGDLPGNVEVTEADLLTARTYLQVDLAERRSVRVREPLPRLARVDGAAATPAANPECLRIAPTSSDPGVVVDFPRPGSIGVTSELSGTLTAVMRDQDGRHGRTRPFTLREGDRRVLNVTAAGFAVRLGVPAGGATELCGLHPLPVPSS